MSQDQIDQIQQAIRLTQRLRTHVTHIFRDISDGFADTDESSDKQEQQKVLMSSLRTSVETVNNELR